MKVSTFPFEVHPFHMYSSYGLLKNWLPHLNLPCICHFVNGWEFFLAFLSLSLSHALNLLLRTSFRSRVWTGLQLKNLLIQFNRITRKKRSARWRIKKERKEERDAEREKRRAKWELRNDLHLTHRAHTGCGHELCLTWKNPQIWHRQQQK